MRFNILASVTLMSLLITGAANAALTFATPAGFSGMYTENFDEMGTTGTTTPAGWDVLALSGSHDNFSYAGSSTSITTTHSPWDTSTSINVGLGTSTLAVNDTLTVNTFTGSTGVKTTYGYNFGSSVSPNVATDRALGTSPTGSTGTELQLGLTNSTGADINTLNVSYDIRRFSTTVMNNSYPTSPWSTMEEFPGYSMYYSFDGGNSWTNVSGLNPQNLVAGYSPTSGPQVPNTVGVTNVPTTAITLSSPWTAGSTLLLRWYDDNAQGPSPDQNYGLDNLVLSSVPEPTGLALLGLSAIAALRRRRQGN